MLNEETIQNIFSILEDSPNLCTVPMDSALTMTVTAFVKENISWERTERVINELGEYIDPYNMLKMDYSLLVTKLAECENPKRTAIRLKACAAHMVTWGYEPEYYKQYETQELREKLKEDIIKNSEIVDFILLYVHNRCVFPQDKNVIRLLSRIADEVEVEKIPELIINALGNNTDLMRRFYLKISSLAAERCTEKHPACIKCPLLQICAKPGEM